MTSWIDALLATLPFWVIYLAAFSFPFLEASVLLGFVVPGEAVLIFTGVLAGRGSVQVVLVLALGIAGAVLGDSVGYVVGRRYGAWIQSSRPGRLVGTRRWESAEAFLRRRGPAAVFLGRFTALLRALVPGAAGMAGVPFRVFWPWNVAGGVTWASLCVLGGWALGDAVGGYASDLGYVVLGLVALAVALHVLRALRHRLSAIPVAALPEPYSEGVDREPSPGGWWRRHPTLTDLVVAGVTFLGAVATPSHEQAPLFAATGTGTLLLLGLASLLLVLRRRLTYVVGLLTFGLAVASTLAVAGASPAVLPPFVMVFTICSLTPRRTSVPIALGTTVALVVATWLTGSVDLLDPVTFALLSWGGMAAALGIAAQSRRAVLEAAEERAVRAEQTRESEAQRRVAEERLRIARELHDVLAHHVSVISVQSGAARHLLRTDTDGAEVALGHVREASQVVLSEIPVILGLLRVTDELEETTPAPGLAQLDDLVDSMRRSGLEVVLRTSGSPVPLSPAADLAAYRLVQEALTNALKHGTGRAEVTLEFDDGALRVTVRNPVAPDTTGMLATGTGHGLVGMRERVAAVGGQLRTGRSTTGSFVVAAELGQGVGAR